MFSAAHKAKIVEYRTCKDIDIGIIPLESLPESYRLSQLCDNVCISDTSKNEEDVLRSILILSACLKHSDRLSREARDGAYTTKISNWLSKAILPAPSLMPTSGTQISQANLKIARQKGIAGLLIFQETLLKLYEGPPENLDPQVLLSCIAFSSPHDPWTTAYSLSIAQDILSKYEHQSHTSAFIVDYVLQQFIRPLFSISKRPKAITASGRKAMSSSAPPRKFDAADHDPVNLPWMYEVPYTITVFEWAVSNSTTGITAPSFNLYLPPLLTLLDNTHTPIRSRALAILYNYLPLLPQKLILQTGLAEVFEDAVTPTLMFLPNLTPVEDSVQLLEGAYQCLVELGTILYANEDLKVVDNQKENEKEKEMKYWDRIMRKGVMMGYVHSSEHPAIVNILVQTMGTLIWKMGVHAVKHLKDTLPILTTTLTDPFAPTHPTLLSTTLTTLQAIIENCWPRLSEPRHKIEIITSLVTCWTNIFQVPEGDFKAAGVKDQILVAGTMFVRAVEGEVDVKDELEPLFERDPGLREVFGMVERKDL